MKIKGPTSPLSSGAEPLEPLNPRELQKSAIGDKFAAALAQLEAPANAQEQSDGVSETRTALARIAHDADLGSNEGAATAVRQSAHHMIRSRLHEKFRDTEQGTHMIAELSEYVASDPLIKSKLLSILQRIKGS
ncbi:MAG TPA: hypothetical protein VNA19_17375 [Pyrinomonadaceae bacterium]|jgi:hypothetical protein|nr:hypothetical protein [Pyrinomonadaceae bacterium]